MVKKFIRNPSKIINQKETRDIPVTGSKGITQRGKTIRTNNRAVPLNPQGSRNNPRAGNFATKKIKSKRSFG